MWDTIKDLLTSRGSQLIARYAGIGLVWLASKEGVVFSADQLTNFSSGLALLVIGAICFGIDHFVHNTNAAAAAAAVAEPAK